MFKIIKNIIIIICFVIFIPIAFAEDVYYLTPSEETIAWNKWRKDISNYIAVNTYMAPNYAEKISFNVDKNKHITNITIVSFLSRDYSSEEFPAHLYGDICAKNNLEPDQIYVINYNKEFDAEKSPKHSVPIKKTKDGAMIKKLYETIKSLEGTSLLKFPEGTNRELVLFTQNGVAADKVYLYKESDFHDYEKVIY